MSAPLADMGSPRPANAVAYVGGALVLVGLFALAFTWSTGLWEITALMGVVGATALLLSWAMRRFSPPVVSDVLAGVAVVSLTFCVDAGLDASGIVFGRVERWILLCAPAILFGGAVCWGLRSRLAGNCAVIGWVLLPLALATGSEDKLGVSLPLLDTLSEFSVWAALALMLVAVELVEQAIRFAARRGWVTPETASSITFMASSPLGLALVIAASVQGSSWFYFVLVSCAAAVTGIAFWQRDWAWLPTSVRLFYAAGISALGGIDSGPGRTMGLVVLLFSLFPFSPLRGQLPDRFAVRRWEMTIWFIGMCVSCAFAFSPGGWPAAGGLWAAGVIVLAAVRRRASAMVLASLALFAVFLARMIDLFGAVVGAGFGTMFFGALLLAIVVVWGERVRFASRSPRASTGL